MSAPGSIYRKQNSPELSSNSIGQFGSPSLRSRNPHEQTMLVTDSLVGFLVRTDLSKSSSRMYLISFSAPELKPHEPSTRNSPRLLIVSPFPLSSLDRIPSERQEFSMPQINVNPNDPNVSSTRDIRYCCHVRRCVMCHEFNEDHSFRAHEQASPRLSFRNAC